MYVYTISPFWKFSSFATSSKVVMVLIDNDSNIGIEDNNFNLFNKSRDFSYYS